MELTPNEKEYVREFEMDGLCMTKEKLQEEIKRFEEDIEHCKKVGVKPSHSTVLH